MKLLEMLFEALIKTGQHSLVDRFKADFNQPQGHWRNYGCERQVLCSFLNVYLDHRDQDARLTLCPTNEAMALVQEILEDVIPVIRRKLGM